MVISVMACRTMYANAGPRGTGVWGARAAPCPSPGHLAQVLRVRLLSAQPDTKTQPAYTPSAILNCISTLVELVMQWLEAKAVILTSSNFIKPIAFYRWAWQDNLRKEEWFRLLFRFVRRLLRACDLKVPLFLSRFLRCFVLSVANSNNS